MKERIAQTMDAVLLNGPDQPLQVEKIEIPTLEAGEVLVKMNAAPINPSDLSFLTGKYTHIPSYPVIPGIEGSGIVIDGAGVFAKRLISKQVICSPSHKGGTWAEYMVTTAFKCIVAPKGLDLDAAATCIVNPLTALSLVEFAKKNKHQGVVINAANSNLGHMMIKLCSKFNIKVVALVRNAKQEETLKALGVTCVLVTDSEQFKSRLGAELEKWNVTIGFDAVSGTLANDILEALPFGSELKLYGRLSGEWPTFNPKEIIQNGKIISGFYLGGHLQSLGILKKLRLIHEAKKMAGAELKSNISKSMPLQNVNEAIQLYTSNMSGGKILLKP